MFAWYVLIHGRLKNYQNNRTNNKSYYQQNYRTTKIQNRTSYSQYRTLNIVLFTTKISNPDYNINIIVLPHY